MGQISVKVATQSLFGSAAVVTSKQTYSTITSDVIIKRVAQTANMKENEVKAAFLGAKEALRYFVLNGHAVKFGDFGTFKVGTKVNSVAQASQCSTDLISSVSLNYTPSAKVKEALSNISFNS